MKESEWHKKVREEYVEKLKKTEARVETSHGKNANLELFRGNTKRANCLSDADIVVFDSDGKIIKIVEVESEPNPKKLIGVVLATHLCNLCKIGAERKQYPVADISLEIIYQKPKAKSKKADKLAVLYQPLLDIIKNNKGCLSLFKWESCL